jgi:hypothetical protein
MEAQNNYVTSLVDPGAYAKAEAEILGDPDFLPNDMPTGNPALDAGKQPFYGPDGYSLDARNGQVLIEIDFKEAVDYEHDKGYLRINDQILFWEYPASIQEKVKGISYQLINVKSTFRAGRFTQKLDLTMNTFGNDQGAAGSENPSGEGRSGSSGTPPDRPAPQSRQTTGLVQDTVPTGGSSGGGRQTPNNSQSTTYQNTTYGGVVDDDAGNRAGGVGA